MIIRRHVVRLVLVSGMVVTAGAPVLGQSGADVDKSVAAGMHGEGNTRFDAGFGVQAPVTSGYHSARYGGWFTFGSGKTRLVIDYWRERLGEQEYVDAFGEYGFSIDNSVQAAIARHFGVGRRVVPHVFAGAGYFWNRTENCGYAGLERRDVCHPTGLGDAVLVLGGGVDVALGSRFFARVQSRGFTFVRSGNQLEILWRSMRTHVFVGAGVRF